MFNFYQKGASDKCVHFLHIQFIAQLLPYDLCSYIKLANFFIQNSSRFKYRVQCHKVMFFNVIKLNFTSSNSVIFQISKLKSDIVHETGNTQLLGLFLHDHTIISSVLILNVSDTY